MIYFELQTYVENKFHQDQCSVFDFLNKFIAECLMVVVGYAMNIFTPRDISIPLITTTSF